MGQHRGSGMGGQEEDSLPFHINVAHLFPREAKVIQDHILGVPDNATQEKPVGKNYSHHMDLPPWRGGL